MDEFRKILCLVRLDSGDDGIEHKYRLTGRSGGRSVRAVQYMFKVFRAAGSTQVGLDLEHGPDGCTYTTAAVNVIGLTAATEGDAIEGSFTGVLGEWFRPVVRVKETNGSANVFATVELYECLKPY